MSDAPRARVWVGRATYAGLCLLLMFLALLPLGMIPPAFAGPDLILAVTLAFVARRPDFVPVALLAAVFLLADLLLQRPPGLGAAVVLVVTEMLRSRAGGLRNMPFPLEWIAVALCVAAVTFGTRLILALTMTPQAPLGLSLIQMVMTILCYPLVVALARLLFGVSRPAPGEVDALGHRL